MAPRTTTGGRGGPRGTPSRSRRPGTGRASRRRARRRGRRRTPWHRGTRASSSSAGPRRGTRPFGASPASKRCRKLAFMCAGRWLPSSRMTSNGPNSSTTERRNTGSCCPPMRTWRLRSGSSNWAHHGLMSMPTIVASGPKYARPAHRASRRGRHRSRGTAAAGRAARPAPTRTPGCSAATCATPASPGRCSPGRPRGTADRERPATSRAPSASAPSALATWRSRR